MKEWYSFGAAATMESFESLRGDAVTEQDASFELLFRPRDFNGTHVLFETGGNGDGTAILLIDNKLEVRVQNSDNNTRRVVRTFDFRTDRDADKFHHVVATIHPSRTASENQVRLFVNGSEVGIPVSSTSVIADWGGTNESGLGRANDSFANDDDTTLTGNFDGDIALFRFHENRLLSPSEVSAHYDNLISDLDFVTGSYNTGERVGGDATSPPIRLDVGADFTLSFDTLIEAEDAEEPFERMQVIVRNTATSVEEILLDRFDGTLPADTQGAWTDVEIDLSPFSGEVVQIIFRFDSVDNNNNNFEGWWIDNLQVTRSATPTADVDQFAVDLSAHVGEPVDILLAGQAGANYAGQTLELRDATGSTVLASAVASPIQRGTNATNYDLGIVGYQVATPGIHTIRVVSNTETSGQQYSLVVSPKVAIETEPNEDTNALRVFDSNDFAIAGYLRSGAIQVYESRGAFEADNPGLQQEDFEGGVVRPSGIAFTDLLNSQTANSTFPSGIAPGVSISASDKRLALVGADFSILN